MRSPWEHADSLQPTLEHQIRFLSREIDDGILSPAAMSPARKKQPLGRFPVIGGLRWDEVTITFIDNDMVRIAARDKVGIFTFTEMGFKDGRSGKADKLWRFFHVLAQEGGELTWSSKTKQSIKRNAPAYVKIIRDRLQVLMGIDDDPFENYKKVKAYKTKFTLRNEAYAQDNGRDDDD
jgi:hypothetical protein